MRGGQWVLGVFSKVQDFGSSLAMAHGNMDDQESPAKDQDSNLQGYFLVIPSYNSLPWKR